MKFELAYYLKQFWLFWPLFHCLNGGVIAGIQPRQPPIKFAPICVKFFEPVMCYKVLYRLSCLFIDQLIGYSYIGPTLYYVLYQIWTNICLLYTSDAADE